MKKVVITGMGAVTPSGNSLKETWEAIKEGCSAIDRITKFDTKGLPCRIGGEVKNLDPGVFLPRKDLLRLDPFIYYATASAMMAFEDAELDKQTSKRNHFGVVIGSSRGGIMTLEEGITKYLKNKKFFSAYMMPSSTIGMASSYIAMRIGLKGPSLGLSNACASGANAIGEAMRIIQRGDADVMLAGGAEAPLCPSVLGGYSASKALSTKNQEPEKASRPFDAERDGFVLSEGASVVVLEEMNHALKRNAHIYSEIVGYSLKADAYHQTKPDPAGEAATMEKAIHNARIHKEMIGYINAHATSTVLGDKAETEAIKKVFKERASSIPVSSIKSTVGHMLGASGALEVAITTLAIHDGIIPPTINLEKPDSMDELDYVLMSRREKNLTYALSNSFGFGGTNAAIVMKKVT